MGLDMYLMAAPADSYNTEVDFDPIGQKWEVAYWRKHNALHGWMEALYRSKGGLAQEMCAEGVNITAADLDDLEKTLRARTLPVTTGFFFGSDSSKDDPAPDLVIVEKARYMLSQGMKVYYVSSW